MGPIEENGLIETANCLNKLVAMHQSAMMHDYAKAESSGDGSDADSNTINPQPKKLRPHRKATNYVTFEMMTKDSFGQRQILGVCIIFKNNKKIIVLNHNI
jgi:hypothetical protein